MKAILKDIKDNTWKEYPTLTKETPLSGRTFEPMTNDLNYIKINTNLSKDINKLKTFKHFELKVAYILNREIIRVIGYIPKEHFSNFKEE